MASLSSAIKPTLTAVLAARVAREYADDRGPGSRLGPAILGKPCLRQLWYTFRWCAEGKRYDGQRLRLFETGKLEEARMIQELRAAGVTVHDVDDRTGKQFRFTAVAGHVGGFADGVALGILERPDVWHLLELKSHNAKNFAKLLAHGVKESHPEHWAQVIIYMGLAGLERGFYMAVNKDTDELYTERVRFDAAAFERFMRRATDVVESHRPLERVSNDPAAFVCAFCDFRDFCHRQELPQANCRTCAHATPDMTGTDGRWLCAYHRNTVLTYNSQRAGCANHLFIPELVSFAEQVDASEPENWIEYRIEKEGGNVFFRNGGEGAGCYSSKELKNAVPGLIGDPFVEGLRQEFGAEFEQVT